MTKRRLDKLITPESIKRWRRRGKRSFPEFVHPLAWAAGVFDSCARIRIDANRIHSGGGITVSVNCGAECAESLMEVFGCGWVSDRGHWIVPAESQAKVLSEVLQFLRVESVSKKASAVLQFRLTAPKRRIGWTLSPAVLQLRDRLGYDRLGEGRAKATVKEETDLE